MTGDWYQGSDRRERIAAALDACEFDALLAVTPENAHYLAGHGNYIATHWRIPGLLSAAIGRSGKPAVSSVDFGADPSIVLPYRHFPFESWIESIDIRQSPGESAAIRTVAARPVAMHRPAQFDFDTVWDQVAAVTQDVAPKASRIGADLREVDQYSVEQLLERLPGVMIEDATHVFEDLRAVKDTDELEHLRTACVLTELGIYGAMQWLHPGMTELAVNSAYQVAVHEQVMTQARFSQFRQVEGQVSIGIGTNSPRIVEPGQTIKFDMQVDIAGYHSDVGRTVAHKPTSEQREVFAALHEALQQAEKSIRPGVRFSEIHETGTAAMHDQGFTSYSRGHLGHSLGLTQHFEEPPFISADEHRHVAESMMLSLELPYYIYGIGAFQLERMIEVNAHGAHAIDRLPFEFAIGLAEP